MAEAREPVSMQRRGQMRWNMNRGCELVGRRRRRAAPRGERPHDLPRSPAAAPLPGRAGRARARLPRPRSAGQVGRRNAPRHHASRRWSCDSIAQLHRLHVPQRGEVARVRPGGPRARARRAAAPTARCGCASTTPPGASPCTRARATTSRTSAGASAAPTTSSTRSSRSRSTASSRRAATRALAALRAVSGLAWFHDPFGFRHEISWGLRSEPASFRPGRPLTGFVTGDGGLGHAVLMVPDLDAAEQLLHRGARLPALRPDRRRHLDPLLPLQRATPHAGVRGDPRHGRACTT